MRLVDHAWHDLKHAVRLFAKSPGFTAIAVISIACGTGANVAMFSAADAMLLRPLPVRDANSLITINAATKQGPFPWNQVSHPEFTEIRTRAGSFASLFAYSNRRAGVSVTAGDAKQVKVVTSVSGNFFDVLGVTMHLGRGFVAEEDRVPGRDAVAVISYGMWRQAFAADPSVIGRQIAIGGRAFAIVGVAAESFTGVETDTARESVYVPLAMWAHVMNQPGIDPFNDRSIRGLIIKGRLHRGASVSEAQAELSAISRDLERRYPESNSNHTLVARTEFQWRASRTPYRTGLLLILTVLSSVVLLVACANVAGLLTSRAPMRARELAVRLAMGGGRTRLVTQLLTESLLVAVAGGVAGLAVGYAGIAIINQLQYPTDIVAVPEARLDLRGLAFSLTLAMMSAVLFGLGPALATTKIDLSNSFRATDASVRRRWRLGGRSQLVTVQVALSLLVITVAAIGLQTFAAAFRAGPGFRTTQLAKITIDAGEGHYSGAAATRFFEQTLEFIRALPGVVSVGATSAMPLWGVEVTTVVPANGATPDGTVALMPFAAVVDEGYFAAMDIAVLRGRAFDRTDSARSAMVAVVNDTLAKRYWPSIDAVGQRFHLKGIDGPAVEVVGVVAASMYHYPAEPPMEMIYYPYRQHPRTSMTVLAHTDGPSAGVLPALRDAVHAVDPNVPTYDAHTMERFYAALSTNLASVILALIGGIGVIGVTIAVIGLYGLVSYSVSRRTREIGIRIAVGATYAGVLRLILRQGLAPAWIGLACGCFGSVAAARLLPSIIPFTEAYDARGLFGFVPLLLAVTLVAALLPARRAATVNPAVALRHE
jgi:predicted permease